MGSYFNPVEDVQSGRVGRFLRGDDHGDALKHLREGEHLYALCDRLFFKQVACVDEERVFDEFYSQYSAGYIVSFQLVALNEEAIEPPPNTIPHPGMTRWGPKPHSCHTRFHNCVVMLMSPRGRKTNMIEIQDIGRFSGGRIPYV